MTATVNCLPTRDASPALSAFPAILVPSRFRLADINPLTGLPFAWNRFADLPGYVTSAIEDVMGLTAAKWNRLVELGEVHEVVHPDESFSTKAFLCAARRRRGPVPVGVCGDCRGTCVMFDTDGSVTGTQGTAILCICAEPIAVLQARAA